MPVTAALALLRGLPWRTLLPIAVVVAIVLAFGVVRCQRDRAVEAGTQSKAEAANNGQSIVVLEGARIADDGAATKRQADTARLTAEARQLQETSRALPDKPLSDRARARLDRVRQQQSDDGGKGGGAPASDRPRGPGRADRP